jgi:HD-GYP domain-containing protein (c-di-GMP phosphodiesterase class II)
LQLTDRLLGDGTDEVDHAANVCYLSLGIALRMTGYIREARRNAPKSASDSLLTLSLAAIMHDIGKIVGDNPSAVNNVLTADEDDVNYHAHVAVGANLLTDYRDKAVGKIVLNHHQRFDGTGFPALFHREPGGTRREPVSGTHIHIFARIVGLADAFERLRSQKSGPHAIAYAYANVLGEYRSWFDPQLLDALPEIIRPYFPGEMLALKDGSVGAVDSTHAGNPLAADLKIVFDPAGKMIPPAERRGLQIDAVKLLNLPEPSAPVTSST